MEAREPARRPLAERGRESDMDPSKIRNPFVSMHGGYMISGTTGPEPSAGTARSSVEPPADPESSDENEGNGGGLPPHRAPRILGRTGHWFALRCSSDRRRARDCFQRRFCRPSRSEERRVGQECRSRGSPYHEKKKS